MSGENYFGIEVQIINANREPPRSRPVISLPGLAVRDEECRECGSSTKGGALLRHEQRIRTPGGKPFLAIITDVLLCERCAAAGRKRGWPALTRTWRYLSVDAAREFIESALRPSVGGVQ